MNLLVVMLAAFLAATAFAGAALCLIRDLRPTPLDERLRMLTALNVSEETIDLLKASDRPAGPGLMQRLRGIWSTQLNLFPLLEQAGFPNYASYFYGATLICGLLAIPGALFLGVPMLFVPPVAAVATMLPFITLLALRQARFRRFAKQFPDALELVARALRAGHSLPAAMQCVADDTLAPVAHEFELCCRAQSLGTSTVQALQQMCVRVPNDDLRFFTTCVTIQKEMGGNLAEICEKIAYIVRDRFRILAQVQALTGEGRLSGSILMALPVVLFVVVYKLSPDYTSLLFEHPVGRQMLLVALALQVLGAIAINRIVNIRV